MSCLDPHTRHGSLLKFSNFIHPNLPRYTQLEMSTNIVGKVPAMD